MWNFSKSFYSHDTEWDCFGGVLFSIFSLVFLALRYEKIEKVGYSLVGLCFWIFLIGLYLG